MKTKELMIGDCVQVKPSMIPIQVAAVHKKKVGYHAVTNKLNWVRIGLLEPIPITEEILMKNGFSNNGMVCFILCITGYNYCEIEINLNNNTLRIIKKGFSAENIRFVHELQHALKLCKIDKEIEL